MMNNIKRLVKTTMIDVVSILIGAIVFIGGIELANAVYCDTHILDGIADIWDGKLVVGIVFAIGIVAYNVAHHMLCTYRIVNAKKVIIAQMETEVA